MKKKIIILTITILSLISLCVIGFFIYGTIMTFGNSRMPIVEVPKELIELEKEIVEETNGSANFYEIPKHKIENCDAELYIYIYVNNDSITKSKELLDTYISSVNKRVHERLVNKKCIDSIIIDVSAFYSKRNKNLQSKNYRYSFSIKE